jgi:exopolysaccharide biosynthesis polyprenyl glycosylphosphotransferase
VELGGVQSGQGGMNQRVIHRFLFVLDFCLIWAGAAIAQELQLLLARAFHFAMPAPLLQATKIGALLLFSLLVVLFMQLQREYAFFWKKDIHQETRLLVQATLGSAFVTKLCIYLFGISIGTDVSVTLTVALSWILLMGWRRLLQSHSIAGLTERRNVLIVGCGPNGKLLRDHLEGHPELGYAFKGYVDRRLSGKRPNPARNEEERYIVGPADKLEAIARERFIDEIFVSVPADRHLVRLVARNAGKAGVLVRVIPDMYDGLAMSQPFEFVGQFPTLTIHQRLNPTLQLIVKRLIDIAVSAAALFLLVPVLLLIAVIVRLDSSGPALYESFRVGKKGRTFVCYKFRTMADKADELQESLAHLNERQGILFKISADPRVTCVGRFLRKYSIDELPQLWNVLKGDMSLVGPRPPVPREYNKYALEHLCRLDVTPGVTGLWQVNARQDPSFESYIELDKNYVNNWSLWLDCQILWKTIGVVIGGTGQ